MQNKKTALVTAVDYLAKRPYSVREMQIKLQHKGFEEAEITAAIARLVARGYMDDTALCEALFSAFEQETKYSLQAIRYKLISKGFTEMLVEKTIQSADEEKEVQAAAKLLRAKFKISADTEPVKLFKFLYAKGFTPRTMEKVISQYTSFDLDGI